MNRPIHFEIHAENPERAIKFYQAVFKWEFKQWGEEKYWMITTGPKDEAGINGGLMPRKGPLDGNCVIAYVCTMDVANLEETAAKITSNGGLNTVPKMPIPGMGWLAYYKDTEGNIFGIMQADPTAK